MSLNLTPYEAAIAAAQRVVLDRQVAELRSRMALKASGRSPAHLKAETDRVLAEIADILAASSAEVL